MGVVKAVEDLGEGVKEEVDWEEVVAGEEDGGVVDLRYRGA